LSTESFELEMQSNFIEEGFSMLEKCEQCFLRLEKNPDDTQNLNEIFRLAHNLKGTSRAVGFLELSHFSHELENLLIRLKEKQLPMSEAIAGLLLRCNDFIRESLETLKSQPSAKLNVDPMIQEIHSFMHGDGAPTHQPEAAQTQQQLDDLFEMAAQPKHAPAPDLQFSPNLPLPTILPSSDESIRVSLGRLEKLVNLVGEMVILQTVLREQSSIHASALLRNTVHQLGKVTQSVQDLSMSLRMIPIRQTFQKMQRIVRDVSKELGKDIQLQLSGEDTEVDKTVLEALMDPLVHLVRNAADHGIETPEKRSAAGKLTQGNIRLRAFHRSGHLIIEIQDDGAGMDSARLIQKAREKGLLKPDQSLSDEEARLLIFHPGFSTKEAVSDISGRGVGMDVVRTQIEALQGDIQIQTEVGKGTLFSLKLPLTLAIVEGLVIRVGSERFIIPLSHVHETIRLTPKDIHRTTGVGPILLLRQEPIPLHSLHEFLKVKPASGVDSLSDQETTAIVVRLLEQPFAVIVDEIVAQNQVVVKKLGNELQHLRYFSGGTILGDGKPALILELTELVRKKNGPRSSTTELRRKTA
jgi:two-component system chemotaxis sensor kinase CheA